MTFVTILSINFLTVAIISLLDFYGFIQNYIWKRRAIKKLSNQDIVKIGITGSNGKTSVKNILSEFLSNNYNVVKTPKNFNTPKGLIYTINKLINKSCDCVIFEMGARKKRDIFTLCKIAKPDIGVITTIAPQHMQTFKTIEKVISTKKELPDYLDKKLCVYNLDNNYVQNIYNEKQGLKQSVKIYSYKQILKKKILVKYDTLKISSTRKFLKQEIFYVMLADLYAKNIRIVDGFYVFNMVYKHKNYMAKTSLLGRHNITNILLASLMALNLKVDIKDVIKAISTLKPTEHRLELIKGRINILDDSYNCSIESAKCAIEVLSEFKGEKMVCTPGIIEGGKEQKSLNTQLAQILKEQKTMNIIVGKSNREYFKKVLSFDKTFYVDSLEEAKTYFNKLLTGSTLLILNDLPDDYN